jgi:hypothetical protein
MTGPEIVTFNWALLIILPFPRGKTPSIPCDGRSLRSGAGLGNSVNQHATMTLAHAGM